MMIPVSPRPRAIVLAAGRGERMRPLSDHTPKPLLPVHGRPLIAWHLECLARAGIEDVVINTAWLEEQFPPSLGDGPAWGLRLHYQHEGRTYGQALETAGAVATALPHLAPSGHEPFWLVSGDVYAPDFNFARGWELALNCAVRAQSAGLPAPQAVLWTVPNPDFHPAGDFAGLPDGRLTLPPAETTTTYANIAVVWPSLLAGTMPARRAPLGPVLHQAARAGTLWGIPWTGTWVNVGTPAQWQSLQPVAGSAEPS